MARRLPPLNSLRAFEAAARHRSVSAAARELCVTHGAVSQHVSKLEAYLNSTLFVRDGPRLRLTPEGDTYAARLTQLFDRLHDITATHIAGAEACSTLTIGAYPTFADKLLIPRLVNFRRQWPDVELQIQTSHSALDPGDCEVDVAIRLGAGNWPNLTAHYLFDEELMPVASPELLCGRTLQAAEDLAPFVLLHAQQRPKDWETWLRSAGMQGVDAHGGMHFDHSSMAYKAAVNRLGLAMAQTAHVREDLQEQRLVPCAPLPMKTMRSYFVVHLPSRGDDPVVAAFVRWLVADLRSP